MDKEVSGYEFGCYWFPVAKDRKQADGRYLSANQPGLYRRPRATGGGRRVEL